MSGRVGNDSPVLRMSHKEANPRLQIRLVKDREHRAGVGRDKERIDVFRSVLFIDVPRDRRAAGQYRRSKIELDDILARDNSVAKDEMLRVRTGSDSDWVLHSRAVERH